MAGLRYKNMFLYSICMAYMDTLNSKNAVCIEKNTIIPTNPNYCAPFHPSFFSLGCFLSREEREQ
jgi:hypothetical protein